MINFLFGFKGRINRARMWLFLIGSQVPTALTVLVERRFVRVDLPPGGCAPVHHVVWPTTVLGVAAAGFALALYACLCISAVAIVMKRLHDRNKSAWWLLLFFGVPATFSASSSLQPSFQCALLAGKAVALVPFAITWLVEAWFFTELFLMRGSRGENRFGPDPLANNRQTASA